jgi:hypothetical protein
VLAQVRGQVGAGDQTVSALAAARGQAAFVAPSPNGVDAHTQQICDLSRSILADARILVPRQGMLGVARPPLVMPDLF